MNKVLNGLNFAFAYLGDIITSSNTAEEHLKHIQIIINRLRTAQLQLKKSKCSFFKKELYYLGHLLTTEGIKPQIEKVKAIHEIKPPTTQKGVREFLGMVGYYRKFINRFADAARPLTKLTRKDCKFNWAEECQIGFEYLRTCLTQSPILNTQIQTNAMLFLLMLLIKQQLLHSLKSTQMTMVRLKKCQLRTSQHNSVIPNLSGVQW